MRTITVTEDRSSPMATSRRRSALGEAWGDGATLMSFSSRARSLVRDAWSRRCRVGCALPGAEAAAVAPGAVTHSIQHPVDQESEKRERYSDLPRDREGVQRPLTNSPAYRRIGRRSQDVANLPEPTRYRPGPAPPRSRRPPRRRTGPSGPPVRAVRRPAHPKIVAVTRTHRRHAQTGPLNSVAATFPRRCIE